jgi:hypothetical protein
MEGRRGFAAWDRLDRADLDVSSEVAVYVADRYWHMQWGQVARIGSGVVCKKCGWCVRCFYNIRTGGKPKLGGFWAPEPKSNESSNIHNIYNILYLIVPSVLALGV